MSSKNFDFLLLHLYAPKKAQCGEVVAKFEQFPSASAVFLPTSEGVSETLEDASVWEIKACLGRLDLGIFCNDVALYSNYRIHVVGTVEHRRRHFLINTPDGKCAFSYQTDYSPIDAVNIINRMRICFDQKRGAVLVHPNDPVYKEHNLIPAILSLPIQEPAPCT